MRRKRLLLFSLLIVVIMTTFFAVSVSATPKLNKTKHTIIAGKSFTLKVTGTKKKVTWSSSNKKVATVTKKGVVKALKAGDVTIKAKVAGKTLKCKVKVFAAEKKKISNPGFSSEKSITLTFHQKGWYVARLYVQVWDKNKKSFVEFYSDSRAINQTGKVTIDTDRYEINRVGYQIWFFGWDNDYMNLPWANTDKATDFTLSGHGDYPEFTWK